MVPWFTRVSAFFHPASSAVVDPQADDLSVQLSEPHVATPARQDSASAMHSCCGSDCTASYPCSPAASTLTSSSTIDDLIFGDEDDYMLTFDDEDDYTPATLSKATFSSGLARKAKFSSGLACRVNFSSGLACSVMSSSFDGEGCDLVGLMKGMQSPRAAHPAALCTAVPRWCHA